MKIIVDAMGGDHAPLQIVLGAVDAIKQDKSLQVVLVGDESAINQCLCDCKDYDKNRLSIIDAKDVITNDDTPTTAIRTKKESSLVKAFDALNHDEDAGGFVSAGSTGAVLVGAYLVLRLRPYFLRSKATGWFYATAARTWIARV